MAIDIEHSDRLIRVGVLGPGFMAQKHSAGDSAPGA